jgi:hypothetical protein
MLWGVWNMETGFEIVLIEEEEEEEEEEGVMSVIVFPKKGEAIHL